MSVVDGTIDVTINVVESVSAVVLSLVIVSIVDVTIDVTTKVVELVSIVLLSIGIDVKVLAVV